MLAIKSGAPKIKPLVPPKPTGNTPSMTIINEVMEYVIRIDLAKGNDQTVIYTPPPTKKLQRTPNRPMAHFRKKHRTLL